MSFAPNNGLKGNINDGGEVVTYANQNNVGETAFFDNGETVTYQNQNSQRQGQLVTYQKGNVQGLNFNEGETVTYANGSNLPNNIPITSKIS